MTFSSRILSDRILSALAVGLCFLFVPHRSFSQTQAPKLTTEQWQADIRYLGDELPKRHRNAFHRVKREVFEAAVKNLYDLAPRLPEDEILVGLMKVVALIHDGHTSIDPRPYFRSGIFPVKLYLFSDGLYVQNAAPKYYELVGGKVLRIGKMSVDDALRAVGPVAFADNEMGIKEYAPQMLTIPEILSGLKIADSKQDLNMVVEINGKQRSFDLHPEGSFDDIVHLNSKWIDASKTDLPLYRRNPGDIYWFKYLKDQRILYVKHNAIGNKEDEPVTDFYKRVFEFVDANPVDKFVLDLRNNGGGNNTLNVPVVVGLIKSKINKRGHLFVITGRQTFSAAQNLVNQIEKYTEAIFVGEPTAGHPNHYGDNRPFNLLQSGLTVRASTLWWQDLDPRDDRQWTPPEIAAELSFSDYRSGNDPALQAVLNYVPGSTLSELIQSASAGGKLGDFVSRYRTVKSDPKSKYVNSEASMNRLGYTFLGKKRAADAVVVFKLNVEAYPNSANVYDSLGDALEASGQKEEAIKSFQRALSIDPNYPTSLEALRRLKGK